MNSSGPSLPTRVDTLIIGAGTGGAALAGTLAELSDESILLVDAGPDYGAFSDGNWPADMLDARAIPLSHDYDLTTHATVGDGNLDLPRARIVGGCSAHNGCTASLGARYDYDHWAALGNAGWSADDVEPLLHWVHDRFRVRRYQMAELTPPQRAFVEAGVAAGLPFADDLDTLPAAEGIGPMPVNIQQGTRWNASFAFLDPARDRANLTIVGGARVERISMDDGVARGAHVTTAAGTTFVEAGRIVVAAGAYHSPAILLRSGIGPTAELTALGIDTEVDLPGVGKHLLDHASVQLDFAGQPGLVDELAALDWNPDEQTVGRAKSSVCDEGPYDIHVFMVAGANSGHPGLPPITLYGGAMRAKSEGTVTLSANLDISRPLVDHRYGTDADGHDKKVLAESLELLERMVSQSSLADILGERVLASAGSAVDNIVSYCHPAGTCKMGTRSDPTAVADHDGRVHGTENLFVADASIMPAITRGNINLPTAMIGARIAAYLLDLCPKDVVAAISASSTL
jgi:choline dehydrogenase